MLALCYLCIRAIIILCKFSYKKTTWLEPGIACAGGGETATAAVVADGVAAVVTVAITKYSSFEP